MIDIPLNKEIRPHLACRPQFAHDYCRLFLVGYTAVNVDDSFSSKYVFIGGVADLRLSGLGFKVVSFCRLVYLCTKFGSPICFTIYS